MAAALGLKAGDMAADLPIEAVSTGIFNLMVPVASRKALGKISMNLAQTAKLLGGIAEVAYCFCARRPRSGFLARHAAVGRD